MQDGMHTPAGPDQRTPDERSARELVVETCTRRGVDPGYFLTPCQECGATVMGSNLPLCTLCHLRADLDDRIIMIAGKPRLITPSGAAS